MRSLMIAVLMVLLVPALAQPQTVGQLMLYADEAGSDCMLQDNPQGLAFVHMIVEYVTEASVVSFAVPIPDCWTGSQYLGEVFTHYLRIGDSQTGISISFQGCLASPRYLGYVLVGTQGTAPPCCPYPVLPDPRDPSGFDNPHIVDCGTPAPSKREIAGGIAIVNGDGTCHCLNPVPVETSTWGRVKSLYE